MTFLVLDGVVPGQGDRDYVLRRIVRRAIRYGRQLGIERAFLGDLVDAVVAAHGRALPGSSYASPRRIKQVLAAEEELFSRTLQAGSAQVDRLIAEAQPVLDRVRAKRLRPLPDLRLPAGTDRRDSARGRPDFDRAEFDAALEAERQRARQAAVVRTHQTGASEFADVPATDFLAWTNTQSDARILAAAVATAGARRACCSKPRPSIPKAAVRLATRARSAPRVVSSSSTTRAVDGAGHIVHYGHVEGDLREGELAHAEVDVVRRDRSRRHHTATHLLHRALKDVLGEGTSQQGSYVGPDQLRFDFNYPGRADAAQLQAVSDIINDRGMDDLPVHWEIVPMDQARQTGAVMMFGEKYGDQVRVVSIGDYST